MPKTDVKGLATALKKGVSRIYYLCGADVAGVEKATKLVLNAALGGADDLSLTRLNGRELDISALYDLIQMTPMFTEYNVVLINDYNCEKPYEDMRGHKAEDINKQLMNALKEIPDQTVVIFNVTGFEIKTRYDYKSGANIITDKNKKLADFAEKNGIFCMADIKGSGELAKLISAKVASRGGAISIPAAKELAEMCLCDELTISNEIEKLCAYAGGAEITSEMLAELVHEQNDTTIYNLANAVASMNAKAAYEAVSQLNIDNENRGAALYALTGVFLDLYRGACASKQGVMPETAAADFGYAPKRTFVMKNSMRDAQKFGIERLRRCLIILRDTTVKLNSSPVDPRTAIEQAITEMLVLRPSRR